MEALQFEADIQIWEGLTVLLQAVAGGVDVNSATCTYADVSQTLGPRQFRLACEGHRSSCCDVQSVNQSLLLHTWMRERQESKKKAVNRMAGVVAGH